MLEGGVLSAAEPTAELSAADIGLKMGAAPAAGEDDALAA